MIVVDSLIPKYGKNLRNLHNFHDFETHYETDYRKILIGWNLFIGVRVMVLPGVKIGENAIIGAQSVVTKDVPANDIFAGNPARKIGVRKS